MTRRRTGSRIVRRASVVSIVAAVCVACVACNARPAASAGVDGADGVEVREGDPPPGAASLGPVEGSSGEGCGIRGSKGSYEEAEANLRSEVRRRGGDYVQVTKVVAPHVEGGCYDVRFVVRGAAFRVHRVDAVPVASPAASSAPAAVCAPPCSAGYACVAGTCEAACDPPCGPGRACGQDRQCRPAAAP